MVECRSQGTACPPPISSGNLKTLSSRLAFCRRTQQGKKAMPLDLALIATAVTPHIKKYVTEKASKLASGYADGKFTQLYKRLMPDQKMHEAVESFVAAFDKELRSSIENATLTYPAYQDALKIFLADPDVLEALEAPLDGQSQ